MKSTLSHSFSRHHVDHNKIGVLDILPLDIYANFQAQADNRIKAVASSAAVDIGALADSVTTRNPRTWIFYTRGSKLLLQTKAAILAVQSESPCN
jgi:hypothetical protein